MRNLISALFFAFMALTAFAQTDEPYRLVIHNKDGNTKAFTVTNIDSISFTRMTAPVGVDVKIIEINTDDPDDQYVTVSITPSATCAKYRFTLVPKIAADQYKGSVENMQLYFDGDEFLPTLTDRLDSGQLRGFKFKLHPGVYYSVMVLSYNEMGEAAGAQTFDFMVPEVPIVGSPSVKCNVDEATATTIKITFTPNADCAGYYVCFFEPGLADKQFKEFAPLMGFACMGDMIKAFGQELHKEPFTITWDELAAGVDYEVYAQTIDANGHYATLVKDTASTQKLGGKGTAQMTIELGKFTCDETGGCYQEITFIPNDQTAAHRDIVAKKTSFDDGTWTEEKLLDYMKHDKNPDYPDFIEDPEWDRYGIHKGEFPVNPGSTYYIYSIGKNIDGEYGPFVKKEFTAPDAPTTLRRNTADSRFIVRDARASKTLRSNNMIIKKGITLTR